MDETEIVNVDIWSGEDGEAVWINRQVGPVSGSDWVGELTAARMEEFEMADRLCRSVIADAVATTNRGMDGDLLQPCDEWDGTVLEAEERWVVVLDASEDPGNAWPARPVHLGEPYETQAAAEKALADLFSGDGVVRLVVAYSNAGRFADVTRDRVSIQERHREELVTSCYVCGHPRKAHEA